MEPEITLARRMYATYLAHSGGKAHDGGSVPMWPNTKQVVRDHWIAVATDVLDLFEVATFRPDFMPSQFTDEDDGFPCSGEEAARRKIMRATFDRYIAAT